MFHRFLVVVFVLITLVLGAPTDTSAQASDSAAPPRTSWGAPNLQGVWDFRSITPMQRPEELANKVFLTEEEAARREQEVGGQVTSWTVRSKTA